mmetsp:Transcript_38689/g.76263  ORF Transcript_38689/g.76263 Transcript_38689/m.76263 type:complete len:82 (+) Transcript_38689:117-362(+)
MVVQARFLQAGFLGVEFLGVLCGTLLLTSSGPGRAARAHFTPRAPGPRGGDASLARGSSVAPSAKVAAAPTSSMVSAAPPP